MKSKRLLSTLAAALLCTALLAGCGGTKNDNSAPDSQSETPQGDLSQNDAQSTGEEPQDLSQLKIGLVQLTEHPSLDTIRESFLAELDNLGFGEVQIDYKNAQLDMNMVNSIAQTFVGDEVDVIVAIATPTAIAAAAATNEIPVVFSAVTDPVSASLVESMTGAPTGNVTGVSDAIPVELIFGLAADLTPDAKTFGFVYNFGEINSVSVINEAKAYCEANGLSYLEANATNSSEVQQAALSLVGSIDAYFTPIDNTAAEAMPIYAQVALESGLPIYTGADSMVQDGGLATFGIDYTGLGAETARMAAQILTGTPVSELPVVTMDDFRPVVNQTTADALGIDLSVLGADAEIVTND